jgi:TonB family protein
VLSAAVASHVSGQAVGGVLVDKTRIRPLPNARVMLVDSTEQVRARTNTDTLGQFFLEVPAPGVYRLHFMLQSSDLGMSSALTLAADDFVQRRFLVETPRDTFYFDFQVTRQVAPLPGNRAPRYPAELRNNHIQGEVLVQFVVDTLGRAEMATFKVLKASDPAFINAVRESLPAMHFSPASIGQRLARQLVQMPFQFSLTP